MQTYFRVATHLWLSLALAIACLGVAVPVNAQPAGVGATCSGVAVYAAVRRQLMPSAVGCSGLLVSRAFMEMKLPLRVDTASGAVDAVAFATKTQLAADQSVLSQQLPPGTNLNGVTAEVSLVLASKIPSTKSQIKPAPLVLWISPAQAVAGSALLFNVTIQPASNQAATYQAIYWVASGTAKSGSDFAATRGLVTLTPGATATLRVDTLAGSAGGSERTLTMNVMIVGAVYASAQGTIIAPPNPPPPSVPSPVPVPVPVSVQAPVLVPATALPVLHQHHHFAPVSFAISSATPTLREGATIKAIVSRNGSPKGDQTIDVIFTDPAACAGPADRRRLVFKEGKQSVAISKVICWNSADLISRTVSIRLVAPPPGAKIAVGKITVDVAQGSLLEGWLIIASGLGAVVAGVAFAVSRLRFRRRWRKALPKPLPVSALCTVEPTVPEATGRATAGPAIRIDIRVVFDTPSVDRQPKEAR